MLNGAKRLDYDRPYICRSVKLLISAGLGNTAMRRLFIIGRSSILLIILAWTLSAGEVLAESDASRSAVPINRVPTSAHGERRLALVIGNSAYQFVQPLKNPNADATLIAKSLEQVGFSVELVLDANQLQMKRSLIAFGKALRRDNVDVGLVYYAGHGVQAQGENYLIPVDAALDDEDEIDIEAVRVNSFLQTMNDSKAGINIVILDACRSNPFASSFRSLSRGLAPVEAPAGTYIAYSTSPGRIAQDGEEGGNSPYSQALAEAITVPGLSLESVFKMVRRNVIKATGSAQVPWDSSSITGEFYFSRQESPGPPVKDFPAPVPSPEVKLAPGISTFSRTDPPSISATSVGKAIFYEERTATKQGSADPGNVIWSLVQESPGGDLPREPAIRAEATIPGKNFRLRMTFRRNTDKTLPASHIVEMIFLTPDGFEGGGVDNILRVAMKSSEQDAGSPLIGIPAKISDGFFLVALNDAKADEDANLTLLRSQQWFDIPIVYKSGRRALMTLEKGSGAEETFQEALQAWAQLSIMAAEPADAPKKLQERLSNEGDIPDRFHEPVQVLPPTDDASASRQPPPKTPFPIDDLLKSLK